MEEFGTFFSCQIWKEMEHHTNKRTMVENAHECQKINSPILLRNQEEQVEGHLRLNQALLALRNFARTASSNQCLANEVSQDREHF